MKRIIAALLSVGILSTCSPAYADMKDEPYICAPYAIFDDGSVIALCVPFEQGEPA